ncbi:MAG: AAA family ATPase [bacterium]
MITAFVGGVFEFLGLGFNWLNALIELGKVEAVGVGSGVALGVAVGVGGAVAIGIVFGVTFGVAAGVVVGGEPGGVAESVAVGVAFGMSAGVAFGMVGGMEFGVVAGVAGAVAIGMVEGVARGVAFGMAFGVAYFRFFYLINYLIYYFKSVHQPTWTSFAKLPIFYDEAFPFPLPRLHRLLVTLVKADRTTGMKAINFIIQERPRQLSQARRALFEIAVHDLSSMQEFRQIANAPQVIGFLQGIPEDALPKQFANAVPFLQAIPLLIAQYLAFTTIYSRKKQLEIIAQELKHFQFAAAYITGYFGRGMVKVAYAWGELLTAEEAALQRQIERAPIPNPFVVGNPLRGEDKEVFQGREDVARLLENEIMRDKSMSPLLLYGKRRIGKTSTLLNLRKLLGPKIIPVYLDGQDAALTQSDAGFLYQTLAKILQAAPKEWTAADSLILPNRQEFEAQAFELSGKLLGQLRERLQADNARVLLCLDEYERLDRAYEQGRITDDLLDQLRHYLQHETRLAFLFAGAHRMTERRAIRWSDYLINVKTIKLGFLDPASAEKLITAPIPDWPLKYEPGVVEQILQITHRQPYLLQAVASDLVDYLNTQQRTRATMTDLAEAIRRVLVRTELYFQNTWEEDLTKPERALILAYLRANGSIDPVANKEVLHGLVQNDIFEVIEGRHVFVIDLFKRWILKNLPV